jgi:hypothetical protein
LGTTVIAGKTKRFRLKSTPFIAFDSAIICSAYQRIINEHFLPLFYCFLFTDYSFNDYKDASCEQLQQTSTLGNKTKHHHHTQQTKKENM